MLAEKRYRIAPLIPPLVSLALGVTLHAFVPMVKPTADASTYDAIAAGLTGHHPYGAYYGFHWAIGGLAVRGFTFPSIVALVYWLLGSVQPGAVGWLEAIVFVPATTALLYVAGREAFGRRVGLVAAWMFALWFPAVWHTIWLLTETLTDMMAAGLLALLAALVARRTRRLAVGAGILLGLLSVTHAAFEFLAVPLIVGLFWHFRVYDRIRTRLVLFFAVGIACIYVPYAACAAAVGLPRLGQGAQGYGGGGGWTFYVASRADTGFHPVYDDRYVGDLSAPGQLVELGKMIDEGKVHVEPHLLATIEKKLAKPDAMAETLTDGDYYRAGIQNLLDAPTQWPEKLRVNGETLFLLPTALDFYPGSNASTWWRGWWRPLSAILDLLALGGLILVALRRRNRLVLFVPVCFQVLLLEAALVESRYVIPLWSSLFLLASPVVAVALGRVAAALRREPHARTVP